MKTRLNAVAGAILATVTVTVAGCGSATVKQSTGSGRSWDGFGGSLTKFAAGHGGSDGCKAPYGCVGPKIATAGASVQQFSKITTETKSPSSAIFSMQEQFAKNTPLTTAKKDVLALLPSDTKTVSYTVAADGFNRCAYWLMQSPALAKLLGARADDAQGYVQVTLESVKHYVYSYKTSNITEADWQAQKVPTDAEVCGSALG